MNGYDESSYYSSGSYYNRDYYYYYLLIHYYVMAGSFREKIADLDGRERGELLFFGDSDIAYWEQDPSWEVWNTSSYKAHNIGVGGCTCHNMMKFSQQVMETFSPPTVVIVCGENDLSFGHTPEQAYDNFKVMIQPFLEESSQVIYIGTKDEPCNAKMHELYAAYDKLLLDYASSLAFGTNSMNGTNGLRWTNPTTPPLVFVDGNQGFDALGNAGSLYQGDGIHLSPEGYGHWTRWTEAALGFGDCVHVVSGECALRMR